MIINFLLGATVCFAGTLPFGPINLTVAKTTIEKNHWRGFEVAAAAALVEIFQVLIAIGFGQMISAFLEDSVIFRAAVATAFLLLGVYFYQRAPRTSLRTVHHDPGSEIRTGLLVAALNPQAIPFWIIALALIADYTDLVFEGSDLALFLGGVVVGKLLALSGFIAVANYLKTHLSESGRLVNHVLGVVLMLIGVIQWLRLLLIH